MADVGEPRSNFANPGQKTGLVSEHGTGVVIRMSSLPIGKNHNAGTGFANDRGDFQPVLPSVLDAAVGDVESASPAGAENVCGIIGFTGAIFGGAAGAGFALS